MPAGRPTKLTPELQEAIVRTIQAGNYIETAAAYAGVDKASLYAWMKRGNREKSGIYHQFLNAVQMALASAETRDVALIAKAATEDWKAAAWRLERKFPDRWGRRDKVTVLQALAKDVEAMTDAELLAEAGIGDPETAGDSGGEA